MNQPPSPDGQPLRDLIITLTGIDPVNDPEFNWATDLPCDTCSHITATAVVSLDGATDERMCVDCLHDA